MKTPNKITMIQYTIPLSQWVENDTFDYIADHKWKLYSDNLITDNIMKTFVNAICETMDAINEIHYGV